MSKRQDYQQGFSDRASTVRARTYILTLAIVIGLIFYFLLTIIFNAQVNIVDLIFIATIQIVVHSAYFPDGELYGARNKIYINNKKIYNLKATAVNNNRKVKELREYCEYEYEERKKQYIINELGALGISDNEFAEFKKLSPEALKTIKEYEIDGKLFYFNRSRRKRLYALIFKKLPVEKNSPETILAACENNSNHRITDGSVAYKIKSHIKKVIIAIGFGFLLAYIGFTFADGITFEKIARLVLYIVGIFTTAIMSFSRGETCSKVYKNQFYIDLSNFLDEFFEWLSSVKDTNVQVEMPKEETAE